MATDSEAGELIPRTSYIPVDTVRLFCRDIGRGYPIIVLHGGPDFDHTYLLPGMDRLAADFRLIYYDQRGRGRSAANVQPEDVSMQSDIADVERVRRHFRLARVAVLGHSWGGLLAMEYAIRHPDHLSHLILMNSAPASHDDYVQFRQERRAKYPIDVETLRTLSLEGGYQQGDPDAVTAYYRVHFRAALRRPEHLDALIKTLRRSFTREGILKARAIEDRLVNGTWLSGGYDLLPQLRRLRVPTLAICGRDDLIPVECSVHITEAMPGARLAVLPDCGHFCYLESPAEVHKEIAGFLR